MVGFPWTGDPRSATLLDMRIAERLARLRSALGLTQRDLADGLGISVTQLSKYESGVNRLTASRLVEISRLLHISPDFFFKGLWEDAPGLLGQPFSSAEAAAEIIATHLRRKNPGRPRKVPPPPEMEV